MSIIEISIKTGLTLVPSFKILTSNKIILLLEHILCIYYPIHFKKDQAEI